MQDFQPHPKESWFDQTFWRNLENCNPFVGAKIISNVGIDTAQDKIFVMIIEALTMVSLIIEPNHKMKKPAMLGKVVVLCKNHNDNNLKLLQSEIQHPSLINCNK